MKLNQKQPSFTPVTITLESEVEVAEFYQFLNVINLPRIGVTREVFDLLLNKVGMNSTKAKRILEKL